MRFIHSFFWVQKQQKKERVERWWGRKQQWVLVVALRFSLLQQCMGSNIQLLLTVIIAFFLIFKCMHVHGWLPCFSLPEEWINSDSSSVHRNQNSKEIVAFLPSWMLFINNLVSVIRITRTRPSFRASNHNYVWQRLWIFWGYECGKS